VSKLPKGWVSTTFQSISSNSKNAIVDGPFGSNLKVADYINDKKGVPVLTTKNLEKGFSDNLVRYISYKKFLELKRSEVKGGDIIVAKIGSVGKSAIYPDGSKSAMIPANLLKFTVNKLLMRKYIFSYLQSQDFFNQLKQITTATAQPAFNVTKFRRLSIPLPPLPEQHRIVAKIEELFTRLDAGVEALQRAKTLLKRYRQSVLKAAVEGRLTEDWRKENGEQIEPASVLLERIQAERKQRLGKNYKPPKPIDTSNLPELPEGWAWARVASIGEVVTGTTPSKKRPEYYGNGYPFYKPTDLNCGYYVHNSADSLSVDGIKRARLLPENTVLVTCIGATIGKTGLIRRVGASNQQINAILNESAIIPEYLFFSIISPFFQNRILSKASSTTLPILNKSKFEELPIMIPSTDEQLAIVSEIERLFSIIDESEQIIDAELQRSQSLRQSILKRAFAGKLVPQNPADEPASVLLERIRKEKKI